jgi:hypothetical protein
MYIAYGYRFYLISCYNLFIYYIIKLDFDTQYWTEYLL